MKSTVAIVGVVAGVFGLLVVIDELAPLTAVMACAAVVVVHFVIAGIERRAPPETMAEPVDLEPSPLAPLHLVVATLPDPAVVVDAEGAVVTCNDQATVMLGALRVGQKISGAVRAPVFLEALDNVILTGETARVDYEQRVPIERRFEVYMARLPEDTLPGESRHSMPAVLLIMRDLTQQERVERMRADFVAYASHELRTPLSALLGFIETLQGAAKDDARAREEFLELMRVQANRMTRLIGDLLSLSRIELNAHIRPDKVVELEQAVGHVLEYLAPLADESGIEVITDFQLDASRILGDWDELVQVVQNLIDNAMNYGQTGERVEVTISQGPDTVDGEACVDLKVRDFGPGIAPEHLPRLTERFYRVDAAQSRKKGGTGLGLAIVKHIVNRHRGKLLIDSELGKGSEFVVRLPLMAPDGEAEPS